MTKKKTGKARINYFVDLIIAVGFLLTAVSGLVLFFAGSGGYQGGGNPHYLRQALFLSRWTWRALHDWGGIAMLGGVLLHLVLHWKWIVCMTRNLFARRSVRATPPAEAQACPVEL
jgi:cytochrome b subunit of formate dehydrogenase